MQVIAGMAKNALMFQLGLAASYSAIAIPALTGKDPLKNPNEFLRITDDQVSWLGECAMMSIINDRSSTPQCVE